MSARISKRTALDFKLDVVGLLSQKAKKAGLILVGIRERVHSDKRSLLLNIEVASEISLKARKEDEIVTRFCTFATHPGNTVEKITKVVCEIYKITEKELQTLLKKHKLNTQ